MTSLAKRRRNVARATLIGVAIGLGVAGLAVGTVALARRRKKRNYVGSGWDWPQRNRFPTEQSFGLALNKLGYGAAVGLPGWEILSIETIETVRRFQRDFNAVIEASRAEFIIPKLDDDGLIGERTISALIYALDVQDTPGDSWIGLVSEAKQKLAGVVG